MLRFVAVPFIIPYKTDADVWDEGGGGRGGGYDHLIVTSLLAVLSSPVAEGSKQNQRWRQDNNIDFNYANPSNRVPK
jgi:hypothetical protein